MKIPALKFAVAIPSFSLSRSVPGPTIRILRRRSVGEWAFWACLVLYAVVCVIVYFQFVQPWIAGNLDLRIGADSDRYWAFVESARWQSGSPLISATQNFLGPAVAGLLLRTGFAVMCMNFVLFGIALKVASSIEGVNNAVLGFLVLLNAELLPTLTTLNKEIFALLAAAMTAKYLLSRKRSKILLAATLLVSMLARWEQVAVLLLYLLLDRFLFRGRPWRSVLFLVLVVTVAYPLAAKLAGVNPDSLAWLMQDAGSITTLNSIQNSYGFPLVVIPKILMLIAGPLLSPRFYTENAGLAYGFDDPQQEIFQPLGCIALLVLFAYAVRTKRMNLHRPIALFIAVMLITTAASPFIQPRYLYPVYILLCIEVARPRELSSPA